MAVVLKASLIEAIFDPMSSYSDTHEKYNVFTHVFGFLFGAFAFPFLIVSVAELPSTTAFDVAGSIFYGISFLMVFGFSSLYHFQREPDKKYLLKKWDHISIYYLIAGSYSPFLLAYASQSTAVLMLSILWGLAFTGTVFKIFYTGKYRIVSTGIYLAMGWSIVAAPSDFVDSIPPLQFTWIWVGGGFYTLGVLFYLVEKIPYNHAIWHVFVVLGAMSHFIGVWSIFQG